jgi:hypothetical protein
MSLELADGRHALLREARTYDVIELDALRPQAAYSGNLYSLEFYRLCAKRLSPGGLMCTWAPTWRVHQTFRRVFRILELTGTDPDRTRPIATTARPTPARPTLPGLPRRKPSGALASARLHPGPSSVRTSTHLLRDELVSPTGRPGLLARVPTGGTTLHGRLWLTRRGRRFTVRTDLGSGTPGRAAAFELLLKRESATPSPAKS